MVRISLEPKAQTTYISVASMEENEMVPDSLAI